MHHKILQWFLLWLALGFPACDFCLGSIVEGILEPLSAECGGICSGSCVEGGSEVLAELLPVDDDDWRVEESAPLNFEEDFCFESSAKGVLELIPAVDELSVSGSTSVECGICFEPSTECSLELGTSVDD